MEYVKHVQIHLFYKLYQLKQSVQKELFQIVLLIQQKHNVQNVLMEKCHQQQEINQQEVHV